MTEIQKNIAVANLVIDELHKDKPFIMKLNIEERKNFLSILGAAKIDMKINHHANGCDILIEESIVHPLYAVMATYIAKHEKPKNDIDDFIASGEFDKAFKNVFGLPKGVVKSLKEVS
ncbi:hypothetical protein A6M14_09475 [Acinetobacter sp. Ac_877]|uniref:hypothetical protein n=1 Tax=Acinetobacter portensis TaxID=1839785 RepID=UPI00128E1BE2|nr:hypothetical protein [Acinetobacter portensis]MPW41697.1 hypothetical protein [Acinetobacter portensis]